MELLYILYLVSGFIKGLLIAYDIFLPVDLTLILASILSTHILFTVAFKKLKMKVYFYIMGAFLFYIWLTFTSIYTPSDFYWKIKTFYYLTNILAFSYPLINLHKINLNIMFVYFIVLTTFSSMIFVILILPYIFFNPKFYEISGLYLGVSLYSGFNLILLIIHKNLFKKQILRYTLLLANLFTLFSSGGRGGIVAFIIVLILYSSYKIILSLILKGFSLNIKKVFTTIAVFLFIFYFHIYAYNKLKIYEDLINRSKYRLELLFNSFQEQHRGNSINERIKMINYSLEEINKDLKSIVIGYGVSSFAIMYYGRDDRGYPHNILLEIWFETGIVGLLIFNIWLLLIIFRNFDEKIFWLFLYLLINILKSSSLTDIRVFFFILALFVVVTEKRKYYAYDR
jgi:hypothetical protein